MLSSSASGYIASYFTCCRTKPLDEDASSKVLVLVYLQRIGFSSSEAEAMMLRWPNLDDLQLLLTKHLMSVPFENLGQHTHPAVEDLPEVPKCNPSIEVHKTLKKIALDGRGGFCWEINFAFTWLLRSLGYKVRMGVAHVFTPNGPVPGHLCLFVDGLSWNPVLVDPGFGDAARAVVPVSVGAEVTDAQLGDMYTMEKNEPERFIQSEEQEKRFDMVLMRSRKVGMASSTQIDFADLSTPPPAQEMAPPDPVYLLNSTDDLSYGSPEFQEGLAYVLREDEQNLFSRKRMCFLLNEKGFTFVGNDYLKKIENGVETNRIKFFGDEQAYRDALEHFIGIKL